jgi:hypothetical protein
MASPWRLPAELTSWIMQLSQVLHQRLAWWGIRCQFIILKSGLSPCRELHPETRPARA